MNKIEIKNLKKDYQNFALKNVNFSIPEGYVTGFIGRMVWVKRQPSNQCYP